MSFLNENKKQIKVFLSSTFDKDMRINRELFRAELNAVLESKAGGYGINIFYRDFELGIPKNYDLCTVMDICFKELEESDYYIAILQDYYGMVINKEMLQDTILEKSPYRDLIEYGIKNKLSILNLEFILACQKEIPGIILMYTYTKEPRVISIWNKAKQIACQSKICIKKYIDSQMLGENVYNFFSDELQKKYPVKNMDPLIIRQRYIITKKLRYYIPVPIIHKELLSYIQSSLNKVFILTGPYGSGKTTALCSWLENENKLIDKKIILAFTGIGTRRLHIILLHILQALYDGIGQIQEISHLTEPTQIFDEFPKFIAKYPVQAKQWVVIIDNIENAEIDSREKGMSWIPDFLPSSIKMVISIDKKDVYKVLQRTKIVDMEKVNSMKLLLKVFEMEGKTKEYFRNKKILKTIFDKKNPLQVVQAANEIMAVARYDTIDKTLGFLNNTKISYGFYTEYLNRLYRRFGKSNVLIVFLLFTLTKRGTSVQVYNNIVENLHREEAEWDNIYYMLYGHLSENDGYYIISNEDLIQYIKHEAGSYLCYKVKMILLDEYTRHKLTDEEESGWEHDLIEISYLSVALEEYKFIVKMIQNVSYAIRLYYYDNYIFCKIIDNSGNIDEIIDSWKLQEWGKYYYEKYYIAEILHTKQYYKVAAEILENLLKEDSLKANQSLYLNELCSIAANEADYQMAVKYCEDMVNLTQEYYSDEPQILAIRYSNAASVFQQASVVYKHKGYLDIAKQYILLAIQAAEKINGGNVPEMASFYCILSDILSEEKRYSDALEIAKKAGRFSNIYYPGKELEVESIFRIATLYCKLGNYKKADEKIRFVLANWDKYLSQNILVRFKQEILASEIFAFTDIESMEKYYSIVIKRVSMLAVSYYSIPLFNSVGILAYRLGRYDDAVYCMEKIIGEIKKDIKLMSLYAAIIENAVYIEEAAGNGKQAEEYQKLYQYVAETF